MPISRSLYLIAMPAFLVGFGLRGVSLHIAEAEGLFWNQGFRDADWFIVDGDAEERRCASKEYEYAEGD